jgi:aminoglycoside phosphotransferase (APT) family kinase protein
MPAPIGRDLELTRKQLQQWLPGVMPDASKIEVGELSGPGATGFSSDTLLCDIDYQREGRAHQLGVAIRIHPREPYLFPEYDLPMQFRVMGALADTAIPVPEMLWQEQTGDVLGDAFYVMSKIEGRALADNPPYNSAGWVTELTPPERARMWRSYLETMAAIHALDPVELGLSFLAKPDLGPDPLSQELAYYESYFRARWGDRPHPTVSHSLPWLHANRPDAESDSEIRLVWGDARPGNMLFRDSRCVAVLDWEMARLANPIMDLAWGTFVERFHTEGVGVERLPGFPTRDEAIAQYEEMSGRKAENVDYYEVLAGMRFSVIMIALGQQMKHHQVLPPEAEFETNNPVSNLHRVQLESLGVL